MCSPTALQVLVVDDNAVNRLVAQRLLERLGCRVVTAGSGQEAIDVLRDSSCDLVLMDCRMPGMDGYQATAAIRELEAGSGRRLPVVAVTANGCVFPPRSPQGDASCPGKEETPIRPELCFLHDEDRIGGSEDRIGRL